MNALTETCVVLEVLSYDLEMELEYWTPDQAGHGIAIYSFEGMLMELTDIERHDAWDCVRFVPISEYVESCMAIWPDSDISF